MATSAAGFNTDQVMTQASGKIWMGLTTSAAAPTGVDSALTGYADLGYLTDDGFEIKVDNKVEQIRAWQLNAILANISKESSLEIKFTLAQLTDLAISLYWGNTPVKDPTETPVALKWDLDPSLILDPMPFVIDVLSGVKLLRYYFAAGQVTDREQIKGKASEAHALGVTLTALPKVIDGKTRCGYGWHKPLVAPS